MKATFLAVLLASLVVAGCPSAPRAPSAPATCVDVYEAGTPSVQELRTIAEAAVTPIGIDAKRVFVEGGASIAQGAGVSLPDEKSVDQAVSELSFARLLDDRRLQYSQILNDCEDRAAVAAAYLLAMRPGWVVGKVFVRGDGALSTAGELVHWAYHVAPFVVVEDGGVRTLRVIDPAFQKAAGLGLAEWLKHFADASKVTVLLRPVTALNNLPVQGEDDRPFCKQTEGALQRLRDYLYDDESSAKEWSRSRMKVVRIEGARVWFEKKGDKTGWFLANDADLPTLTKAKQSGAEVDILYNSVDRGFLRGRFLYLVDVASAAAP